MSPRSNHLQVPGRAVKCQAATATGILKGPTMSATLGHRIRCATLAILCLGASAAFVPESHASSLPLAQAGPAPAPAPSNVTVPGRLYVVEGIVIVLLFAGAIFAVCRSSGRT